MSATSLKIALRGFQRNGFFTFFNLLSLIGGLLVAFLAIGYIGFENSYDKFHENSENIYRLGWSYRAQDYGILGFENSLEQLKLVNGLKNISGIKTAAQFITEDNLRFVEWRGQQVREKGVLSTNTPREFVALFFWKPIFGSLTNFTSDLNKVLLTESTARKLVDSTNGSLEELVGENVKIGPENYQVAAIIEDVPLNSHFDFSMAIGKATLDSWGSRIYIGIADHINYLDVQQQINDNMVDLNASVTKDEKYKGHFLQPMEDIHLKSDILYELKPPGNMSFIYLISGFTIFILIITLFNYANFTLAIKSKQGKAIGIKKTLGADKGAVSRQFMLEGVLLALIAVPLLALLLTLVVPYFNQLMGVDLRANLLQDPTTLAQLVGIAVLMGILASIAPALLLSSKSILHLFDQKLKDNRYENFSVRRYLIISQFVILISITSVSYFVFQQMEYIENKNLGFKNEGILYAFTSSEKQEVFQERLRQLAEIDHVGNGSALGIEPFNQIEYKLEGVDDVFEDANQLYLDYEGLKAYRIETTLDLSNTTAIQTIINRTAAEKLARFKNVTVEELIGTTVITEPDYISETGQVGFPFTIDGIFEDINLFSLREKITPYFITLSPNVRMGGVSIIAFDNSKRTVVMKKIKETYQSINETTPLETQFISQNLASLYKQDKQIVRLVFWMNVLAIVFAAIGIIGITVFLVLSKRKEIGIRKVLGASELHIMSISVKEYSVFISIALLIGWPLAYYTSWHWLSNFAYRITITQFAFPLIALAIFMGTALIVGAVSLNAARKNTAKSLRIE